MHPAPLRAAVQIQAAAPDDVFQAVVGQVIGKATDRQVGQEAGAGKRLDQRGRPLGGDHRGRFVRLVQREALLVLLDHLQLHRNQLDPLADLLEEAARVRIVAHLVGDVGVVQGIPLLFAGKEVGEHPSPSALARPFLPRRRSGIGSGRRGFVGGGGRRCLRVKQQRLLRVVRVTFPSRAEQATLQQLVVRRQALHRLLGAGHRLLILGYERFEMTDACLGVASLPLPGRGLFRRTLHFLLQLPDQKMATGQIGRQFGEGEGHG